MNVLGIHYGHNATAALVKDGQLVFALSEERLNRLKNSNGFPDKVVDYIYSHYLKPEEVDVAVMFQKDIVGYADMKRNRFQSVRNFGVGNINFNRSYSLKRHLLAKTPGYFVARRIAGKLRHSWQELSLANEALKYYAAACRLPKEKILFSRHHASHALACVPNLNPTVQTLVFTMDGEGDGESSTVSVYEQYKLKKLSSNPVRVSLGYFFTEITKLLGMIPNEHEFKVMGLAPYAKQERAENLYERLQGLVTLNDNLEFVSKYPINRLEYILFEQLYNQRFDTVAAFAQIFLEKKVLQWVRAWIAKTNIHNLALGGGVFMSVKLNQKILELPEVENLYVMPSAADESTAIGAAVHGVLELSKQKRVVPHFEPITHLNLGIAYDENSISQAMEKYQGNFNVQKFASTLEANRAAAELLASGEVVARFSGRNEWGARALGNRSILAHAGNRDTVRVINEMIKNRDFWMPFAASVLEEDSERYLKNPKRMPAPFMAVTFNTAPVAAKDLAAAIHPYDFTCRPQVVSKSQNSGYHELISEFKKITGIGGILNTSFNLHGEPNVQTPQDALRTLQLSGLRYVLFDTLLVSKK